MARVSRTPSLFITLLILLYIIGWATSCGDGPSQTGSNATTAEDTLTYVGREACKRCHEKQYELYIGSDHDMAMDHADSSTVLGNFDDVTFTHLGVTSKFYTRDGDYFVFTEGPEGKMTEYKVDYVFGVRPLQQYLVEFPGGRYQCLPLCWDTRPKEEGGQKWFHIYGEEKIPHTDFLYWTKVMQNWNYMCAECHSTNLKKQFDPETDSYHTIWSEIDVSCESCHGPGSAHVAWAEENEKNPTAKEPGGMGLAIRFKDPAGGAWVFKPGSSVSERTVKRDGLTTLETCARCHARRMTIHEDYTFGHSFLDTHRPSLLEDQLYFSDGQIRDEVYVYASFLQSKMYHKGVICSDCHEPHSLKVYVQGNALCYRCHLPDQYGSKSHHFHKDNSTGALCVECHMPERTYMQIDPRRDHSMRNPRPDLSVLLGTPNACTRCHDDQSDEWAAEYFYKWYGKKDRGVHYGETFWEARRMYPEALPRLIALATDTALPAMIRSTAFYYLENYQAPSLFPAIKKGLQDPDPLIRFGALQGSVTLSDEEKLTLFQPLLIDDVRLVRAQAARMIPVESVAGMTRKMKELYDLALTEYLAVETTNADHPFAWLNIGNYFLQAGDIEEAEQAYRRAITIEPALPQSYINLADLYRRTGQDEKGKEILSEALVYIPNSAPVHHSLGLLDVRQGQTPAGVEHLKLAAELEPENGRFAYVYGVALYSTGKYREAIRFLEEARKHNPFDRDILYGLVSYYGEMGQLKEAREIAEELAGYYPEDQRYKDVLKRLNNLKIIKP
ncbi:MAG: tetratricopeptide repeat protein [Bacteroidales bacterium]|nr:tetratricopeptide repeat protein [Bacteroidota bacterium]MBL6949290.1 tetratricopeptide repeat protein [Bacteroidales bacterium]